MAAFLARIRRYWLLTLASVPVLKARLTQSTKKPQALNPRLIESPRLAIEPGGGPAAATAAVVGRRAAPIPRIRARTPGRTSLMVDLVSHGCAGGYWKVASRNRRHNHLYAYLN